MELSVVQKRFLELVAQDVVFVKRGMSYIFKVRLFPSRWLIGWDGHLVST